jgi:hypothetical protein
MATEKSTITLHHTKTTAGTYVFTCADSIKDSASITAVYIRKSAFAGKPAPKQIDMSFTWESGK